MAQVLARKLRMVGIDTAVAGQVRRSIKLAVPNAGVDVSTLT